MSHVRRQIREAVAAAVTGLSTTGSRVFQSRIYPLRDADLPCLLISTDDEQIDQESILAGAAMTRTLTVLVRGIVKVGADLDDALDAIAEQVEPVLCDNVLGGLVKSMRLQGIRADMVDGLEKPVGEITLEFKTLYFTTPAAPGISI